MAADTFTFETITDNRVFALYESACKINKIEDVAKPTCRYCPKISGYIKFTPGSTKDLEAFTLVLALSGDKCENPPRPAFNTFKLENSYYIQIKVCQLCDAFFKGKDGEPMPTIKAMSKEGSAIAEQWQRGRDQWVKANAPRPQIKAGDRIRQQMTGVQV